MQFDLSYTDKDGKRVFRTIEGDFTTARRIAQELAIASGRRAIISRRDETWRVYIIDGVSRRRSLLWNGLTKREVLLRWKLWNESGTQSILIAVPNWYPRRRMTRKVYKPRQA